MNHSNFLISGSCGTGKTSICNRLMEHLSDNYIHLNIGKYVKENKLYDDDYDEERDCHVIDDDALIDSLDEFIKKQEKNIIFDYHGCDFFQSEWIKAVFVLRTSNDLLYRRLEERNYTPNKITENVECEIFQTILDEAKDAFGDEENIEIIELENNTEQDQINNVNTILNWIRDYRR